MSGIIKRYRDIGTSMTEAVTVASGSEKGIVENRRQITNAEILKYESAISSLKTYLNTLAPISRLPDDVLVDIFLACRSQCEADWQQQTPGRWQIGPRVFPYIHVTHVCGRWRNVALATTALWNHIFYTGDNALADLLLARSHGSSLTVEVDFNYSYNANESITPWFSSNLMPRARYIEKLTLAADRAGWDGTMELLRETRSLRSLELYSYHLQIPDSEHVVLEDLTYLKIHCFDANPLDILKLVPITGALSNTLTSLTITGSLAYDVHVGLEPPDVWPIQVDSGALLSALKLLPSLVLLDLGYMIFNTTASEDSAILPALRKLCLTFTNRHIRCITWILEHLSLPTSTRFQIDQDFPSGLLYHNPEDPYFESFMHKLGSKLDWMSMDPSGQRSVLRLDLRFLPTGSSLVGWDTADEAPRFHHNNVRIPGRESSCLDYTQNCELGLPYDAKLTVLPPQFPLLNVEVLRVNHGVLDVQYVTRTESFYALRAMHKLRALCLDNWMEESIAVLISGSDQDIHQYDKGYTRLRNDVPLEQTDCLPQRHGQTNSSSNIVAVPFPALSTMHLFDFRPLELHTMTQTAHSNLMWSDKPDPDRWNVREALRVREMSLGSRLSQLVMDIHDDRKHLGADKLDKLENSVEEFVLLSDSDSDLDADASM